MTHIVILGAGIGGLTTAMELKPLLRDGEKLTVLSDSATVDFNPANHLLAMDIYKLQDVGVDLDAFLAQHNIGFIRQSATNVHPQQKHVEMADGTMLDYDVLVIATGLRPVFETIPGFGPKANTHSICRVSDAGETGKAWQAFVQAPSPVVVGAVQGATNITAAYEYVMIVDADLRRRGIREQAPLLFVTPEPYIGYQASLGASNSREQLESEFRTHDIAWIVNARVDRIDADTLHITEFAADGQEQQRHEIPFKHCMLMPAFAGIAAVQGVEGLIDAQGFVLIDEYQRNPNFTDIYGVGVCVNRPIGGSTPVSVGVPVTGYMIESMAHAAAANIRAQLDGLEPAVKADKNSHPQDSDTAEFGSPWTTSIAGRYAPHLWRQLTEVKNFPVAV